MTMVQYARSHHIKKKQKKKNQHVTYKCSTSSGSEVMVKVRIFHMEVNSKSMLLDQNYNSL